MIFFFHTFQFYKYEKYLVPGREKYRIRVWYLGLFGRDNLLYVNCTSFPVVLQTLKKVSQEELWSHLFPQHRPLSILFRYVILVPVSWIPLGEKSLGFPKELKKKNNQPKTHQTLKLQNLCLLIKVYSASFAFYT